jgi:hypothetical protein
MKTNIKNYRKYVTVQLACGLMTLFCVDALAQTVIDKDAAVQVAVETLGEKLSVDPDSVNIVHVSIMDWSDSSLGCPRPGVEYLQVVTRGAVVMLQAEKKPYRVHVAKDRAIVCDVPTRDSLAVGSRQPAGMVMRDVMQVATADLARRLNVEQSEVTVTNVQSTTWPDDSLGCAVPRDAEAQEKVEGFKITLEYAGQDYSYHTDQQRAIPCPPIALE